MAHGRRNFVKIADDFPEECRHILTTIGTIYHHDRFSRDAGYTADERLAYHQRESRPVMEALKEWLESQLKGKQVEPNSKLGKAMQYLLNHWDPLTLFLRRAGAPLDNNVAYTARSISDVMPQAGLCRVGVFWPDAMTLVLGNAA